MRGGTRQFREPTPGSRLLSLAEAGLPRRTDLRRQEVQHHRETPSSWSLQRYAGNEFHDEARQRECIRSCRHRDPAWYRDHHHSTRPARRPVRRWLHTLLSTRRREDRYLNSYPCEIEDFVGWEIMQGREIPGSPGNRGGGVRTFWGGMGCMGGEDPSAIRNQSSSIAGEPFLRGVAAQCSNGPRTSVPPGAGGGAGEPSRRTTSTVIKSKQ